MLVACLYEPLDANTAGLHLLVLLLHACKSDRPSSAALVASQRHSKLHCSVHAIFGSLCKHALSAEGNVARDNKASDTMTRQRKLSASTGKFARIATHNCYEKFAIRQVLRHRPKNVVAGWGGQQLISSDACTGMRDAMTAALPREASRGLASSTGSFLSR